MRVAEPATGDATQCDVSSIWFEAEKFADRLHRSSIDAQTSASTTPNMKTKQVGEKHHRTNPSPDPSLMNASTA
jgi:hypothetical protein